MAALRDHLFVGSGLSCQYREILLRDKDGNPIKWSDAPCGFLPIDHPDHQPEDKPKKR